MKRFLSIILTAAMLMSATPAVFAENNAVDESVIVAEELTPENQEEVTEEVTENVTEDVSEKISGEGEENSEEQISLMSEENNISLLGSESSEKMTGEVTKDNAAVRVDNIKGGFGTYYFDTLTNAVNAINSYPPSSSNTAEIQILKGNIELADILNVGNESTKVRVQIFANDNCTVKRADGFKGAFFNVAEGSILTFGHTGTSHNGTLTLDGNKNVVTATAPLIVSEGTLIFNRNIILQNNLNQSDSPGAGVYIGKNGSFSMKDGCIENNSTSYLFGGIGGGVYAEGDVTITGGTIQKNTRITTYTGYEGETGNSIYFKSAKTLKITGGNLKCNFGNDDEDIILSSYSMTYKDEDNNETFEYTNCILELSGSPSFNTLKPEIDKRHVIMKKDGSEVTLTVKPEIKITSALNIDSPITILGGWYFDWTVDPEVTYADIPVETQLVTFADGVNASDYVSKFKYSGEETRYFDVDSEGGLSLTDTPAIRYSVTVKNPGITSSFLYCKITVSGSGNLNSVEEGTNLSISHTDTSNATSNYLTFGKYIVTTESGKAVDVDSDNSFIMPNENVTVTAKYNPSPYFYVRSYGVKGTQNAKTEKCPNKDSETGNAWDGGAAEYNVYFLDAGDNRDYAGTVTLNQEGGLRARKYQYSTSPAEAMSSIGNTITATFNIDESKYEVEKVTVSTYDGISIESQYDANTKTATFTLPDIDYGNDAQVYLDVKLVQKPYTVTVKKNIESAGDVAYKIRDHSNQTEKTTAGYNDYVFLTVTPNGGYKIKNIAVKNATGDTISEDTNLAYFTMPASDVTINVEFELDACAITTDIKNGTISGITSPAAIGSDVSFTLAPTDDTYKLDSYKVFKTGDEATTVGVTENNGTYTFTMPNYPVTVSAVFVKKTHTVTVTTPSEGGTLSVDTINPVTVDDTVTITATPSEFYKLDTITVTKESGEAVTVTDNKFTMPDENVTVSATFKKQQFAVTTQTDGDGTITVTVPADGKSAWGEAVEYRVEANAHYDVASITVNGEAVTLNASGIYSFTMPKENATISATFKKHKYNITIEGDNITYTIPGAETFDWGESVTVTITPEQWYSITKVEASDSITVTDNGNGTYSFVMPSADVILTVTATRPTYTVKFDTKGGSTVIDPQVIANGESVVKPGAPEYLNRGFAGWYTSTDFKPENKYNFEQPVTGDITLYARWFLWGDVNGDGRADTTDAYIIQRCRVGLEKYTDMANRMAGFVSGLDKANPDTTDAYDIQRLRVGLITRFSVEDSARGYEFNLEEGTYTVPR